MGAPFAVLAGLVRISCISQAGARKRTKHLRRRRTRFSVPMPVTTLWCSRPCVTVIPMSASHSAPLHHFRFCKQRSGGSEMAQASAAEDAQRTGLQVVALSAARAMLRVDHTVIHPKAWRTFYRFCLPRALLVHFPGWSRAIAQKCLAEVDLALTPVATLWCSRPCLTVRASMSANHYASLHHFRFCKQRCGGSETAQASAAEDTQSTGLQVVALLAARAMLRVDHTVIHPKAWRTFYRSLLASYAGRAFPGVARATRTRMYGGGGPGTDACGHALVLAPVRYSPASTCKPFCVTA